MDPGPPRVRDAVPRDTAVQHEPFQVAPIAKTRHRTKTRVGLSRFATANLIDLLFASEFIKPCDSQRGRFPRRRARERDGVAVGGNADRAEIERSESSICPAPVHGLAGRGASTDGAAKPLQPRGPESDV
jgi:hypothetical protein